jgi:shikimate dehydrogenase
MTEIVPGMTRPLSGSTALYAILGDPIAQVASPALFNTAFRERGIDAVMVAMHVPAAGLHGVMQTFRIVPNFAGLIVTVPHKVAAVSLVDRIGPKAQQIGAINAITKVADGSLLGENFDGAGFVSGLVAAGHHIVGRRALIIGAGGAGRAVAHALAGAGVAAMGVTDIDTERSRSLLASLRAASPQAEIFEARPSAAGYDLVVNCTSVGMRAEDPLPLDVSGLKASTLVADIILKPSITPLLREARSRGCATQQGILMLEAQVNAVVDFFRTTRSDR